MLKIVKTVMRLTNGCVDYTNIINYDVLRSTHERRLNYETYKYFRRRNEMYNSIRL